MPLTPWKIAMLAIVGLMLSRQKARTWLALMAASLLSWCFALRPEAYIVLDLVSGALVLTRPAGPAQRLIGLLFAGMVIVDIGYWVSPQLDGGALYYQALQLIGWAQWAILAAWGLYDVREVVGRRLGLVGRAVADRAGAR